ncbi:protocadherin-11 Y-linked [Octopus bimaculoides]|nr:protocadherin-11 Y-linked [Octopus bimaculoides]
MSTILTSGPEMLFCLCVLLTFFHCYLSEDITYHVKEENIPHTYVGDIATDLQKSDSSFLKNKDLITFSQLQQKGEQLFNVTKTGKLYTVQTLDAESVCSYEKECFEIVKVAVHKSKTFMKILKIKVVIEDINDHQPEFPTKEVNIQFSETDGKGTKRSIENAIDKDLGYQNSLITYELKDDRSHFSLLVVKRADGISSLEIILEKKLDRETKDSYNIEVIAKDGGTPPNQSVLNVKISVEDENDNRPQFSQSVYNFSIEHKHKKNIPVVTLSASDLDIGRNGKISFYFSPKTDMQMKKYFNIDENSGKIFLIKSFEVDTKNSLKLYIEAKDNGIPPLSSIATVMVNVINQHNNPPNIDVNFISTQNHNTATILEDIKVGSFIAYVMVTDNDVGHNGEVNCHIKDDTFKLQSMGSKEYKIVLKKAQKYSQPIEVTSYGDNRPSSNYPTDTLTSRKSSVQCWSERSSRQYEEIPAMSGIYGALPDVSSTIERDHYQDRYVKPPERQLPSTPDVVCENTIFLDTVLTSRLEMQLLLCVLLTFFHCSLSEDITYHVEEEKNPYTYVGNIVADLKKSDSSFLKNKDLITFSQLQQKGEQLFNVTKTGKLYTVQTLDAESVCSYEKECFEIIKVAVHKSKTFMKILKIKVIIEDINDHQPEFPTEEVNIQFSERDGKGAKLSIPNAVDNDMSYENSLITYELKDDDSYFSLLVDKQANEISTLGIILEKKLDRETKDNYNIEVIAKDGGTPPKQSILNVKISVEDENDNKPEFSQHVYNVSIEHKHKKNIPVVTLSASDLDIGRNGKISYYFARKTTEKVKRNFNLDENTGKLYLATSSKIDKEESFKIYIEARDDGSPPLSSIATVKVNVINQHNNPPNIDVNFISTQNHNTATILEDIKVGSFIAYVMVTDNDVGHNGQVNCHIKDDTFKLQSMGSKEYKIVLKKAVDRETQEHYHFTVSCEDKGLPALKTDKDLSIQVIYQYSAELTNAFCFLFKSRRITIRCISGSFMHCRASQKYSQPIEVTSYGDNRPSSNYPTDTLTSRKSSGQCWSERSSRQYEEIPAMSGIYGGAPPDVSSTIERDHYQDRYVKPPERQLPSTPDVVAS